MEPRTDSRPAERDFRVSSEGQSETTVQILREIALLKELVFTRLNAMDTAVAVFHDDLVRVPTDVTRQVGSLKELLESRFIGAHNTEEAQFRVTETKFADMGEAIRLLQSARDRYPEELDSRDATLLELIDQRFKTQSAEISALRSIVETQFRERDTRVDQITALNKVALDAAFAAQAAAAAKQDEANQKAIDKSERAVAETLNKQSDLFKSTTDGLAAQIFDIKDRQTRFEGMLNGLVTTVAEASTRVAELARDFGQQKNLATESFGRLGGRSAAGLEHWGYLVGVVGMIAAILAVIFHFVK